jgi:hypothetical protein
MPRSIAQKESPARGVERGSNMFGEVCLGRERSPNYVSGKQRERRN